MTTAFGLDASAYAPERQAWESAARLLGILLAAWIGEALVADLPGLTGFARGLVGDLDGVAAGLTLRWGSDGTRGAVNRIEEIKELRLVTDLGGRPLGLALALPGPSPRPAPSPCYHRIIRTCARQGVPVPFLADLAYQGASPSAVRGAFGRIRVINRRLPAGRRAGHPVVRPRR